MELHEENAFKIKAVQNALFKLEQINEPLASIPPEKLETMEGIGKSLAAKINEICTTGSLGELNELVSRTPEGVIGMLEIKGIGPKKVRTIWKDLDITDKDALLAACNENKISKLKGFGEKTQESIKQALLFTEQHKDKFMYAELEETALKIESDLKARFGEQNASLSGDIRRKMEVAETIQLVTGTNEIVAAKAFLNSLSYLKENTELSAPFTWCGNELTTGVKVEVKLFPPDEFVQKLYMHSCAPEHLKQTVKGGPAIGYYLRKSKAVSEADFFKEIGLQYIEPEMREGMAEVAKAAEGLLPQLLDDSDLKGILHNHTTYSDGSHTLEQMALYCKQLGYEYLGISDHSKSAFYANGLYENRVLHQHKEIDELNAKLAPFRIFKGIESDILNDGELDYEDNVLASFDFIVASIHSNLKMNEEKATQRLITAIENPFTTMLGHPTGRLLLKREGYPINHKKVIDACVASNVVIEINANPRRLDMDWRWLVYALEKGAWLSVNPDAHSLQEYHNMKYGVIVGRKAGLSKVKTFNALSLAEIEEHLRKKKAAAGTNVNS
jgi:DNA polymerase (family 10)